MTKETELTYDELKELCKELFVKTAYIYGLTFTPTIARLRQPLLDTIHETTAEAYNMQSEAVKKGLWK